ncbi:MAG: serine hydrolase, partial [Candidatus Eremiobacteraeota bacterium]|nr:serine hydrolase [Candidatus Eremiobacteraeota bacterium]
GLQIAHKTGTLEDTLNDVGIVYADPEIYVIAVMTTDLPSLSAGRRFIRRVSSVAYYDLQRFGLWRQNNGDVLNEAAPNGSDSNTMQDESGTPASGQPQPGPTSAPR